jgi:hypothetical protein
MPCDEWTQYVRNYQRAVEAYGEAVFKLSSGPGEEFNRSWQSAERARKNTDAARAALLDHEHEHDHACTLAAASSGPSSEDLILGDQGQSGG